MVVCSCLSVLRLSKYCGRSCLYSIRLLSVYLRQIRPRESMAVVDGVAAK